MYSDKTQIRVRYGETDQMGFVYYGHYALYYEVGRVEAIRKLGISYRTFEQHDVLMPVVKVEARYIQPARYDDLLTIQTTITKLPDRFITFEVEIRNEALVLLHKAVVTLCFRHRHTGKMLRAPDVILEKLKAHFA